MSVDGDEPNACVSAGRNVECYLVVSEARNRCFCRILSPLSIRELLCRKDCVFRRQTPNVGIVGH